MSAHEHFTYVEGCFRCDLSRDEARGAVTDPLDLIAIQELTERLRSCDWHGRPLGHAADTIDALVLALREAREQLATAEAALDRMRELHQAERCVTVGGTDWRCRECKNTPSRFDDVGWPCATHNASALQQGDRLRARAAQQ